ncbi:MAG: hypothetical protein HQK52_19765 [Oligoflexia bacterium]|nr:hypothetical protein [Oligoflexia bacterium]
MKVKKLWIFFLLLFMHLDVFAANEGGEIKKICVCKCDQILFVKNGAELLYINNFKGRELFIMRSSDYYRSEEYQQELIDFGVQFHFMPTDKFNIVASQTKRGCIRLLENREEECNKNQPSYYDGICAGAIGITAAICPSAGGIMGGALGGIAAFGLSGGNLALAGEGVVYGAKAGAVVGLAGCATATAITCLTEDAYSSVPDRCMEEMPCTPDYSQEHPETAAMIDQVMDETFNEPAPEVPMAPIPPQSPPHNPNPTPQKPAHAPFSMGPLMMSTRSW